jgi:hypothetical protein
MRKKIIISSFFAIFIMQIQAQKEITYSIPKLRLGIEIDANLLAGEINKSKMIRENQSYYFDKDYDYHCGFVSGGSKGFGLYSFGLKFEYVLKKRLTIASGVRFSFYNAILSSDRDYFLWKVSETETTSNYVKIKNIHQRNYYLGIPVEIKLFPREKDYFVRHYFIFGTSFNFLVASENNVEFYNKRMTKYSSTVKEYIGKPNFFHGSIYAGIGLKIGRSNYPFGNIDFFFPIINIGQYNENTFAKIKVSTGFGVRTTLQIPMLKKYQLSYIVID